ncbi:MAG: hypothetical protein AB7Q01_16790 [Gammaproteobacteria bacterium]
MKTITITYDETQEGPGDEPLDLMNYLRNEFDNHGIAATVHEYRAAAETEIDAAEASIKGMEGISVDANPHAVSTVYGSWVAAWIWVDVPDMYAQEETDSDLDGACPDDPDGLHHVGCGC